MITSFVQESMQFDCGKLWLTFLLSIVCVLVSIIHSYLEMYHSRYTIGITSFNT